MVSVKSSRRDEQWVVRGGTRRTGPDGELLFLFEELELIKAAELRAALAYEQAYTGGAEAIARVSDVPENYFDADGPIKLVWFEAEEDALFVVVTIFLDWPASGTDAEVVAQVTRLNSPLVRQSGTTLSAVVINDAWSAPTQVAVDVTIEPPSRGKSAADLYRHGADLARLAEAFATGEITRDTVGDLLRGGGAHLLVGQPEGNWLDAKAEAYGLSTTRGKISLAQAVARFANAEDGGLIVIGANAKKIPGGEVIRKVRGVIPRYADTAARYRRVLDERLYPPVLGLRVDLTPTEAGRALILVDVPAQGEELKPFLVHGAITADG